MYFYQLNLVHWQFTPVEENIKYMSGLLVLRDGAISHNWPQIGFDRTIHEKSHNS